MIISRYPNKPPIVQTRWDYGYALLKEAGIYDSAGKPVKQREVKIVFYWFSLVFIRYNYYVWKDMRHVQLGVAGLDLKVGQKYTVKVELVAKKVGQ